MERGNRCGHKIRSLKRSDAVDRTLWRLGCRNRSTPACGDNKPGSRQMMTGVKWKRKTVLEKACCFLFARNKISLEREIAMW